MEVLISRIYLLFFSFFFVWFTFCSFLYFKIIFFLIDKIGFLNFVYIFFSISFIVISYIIGSYLDYHYKLFWIILILITNVFGCFLYLAFGKKNINYRQKKFRCVAKKIFTDFNSVYHNNNLLEKDNLISNYIFDQTGSELCECEIKYFYNYQEVKQIILDKLKMAKKFVFMEFFLFEDGIFLNSVVDILSKKVKEGVEVRLIYDGLGSFGRIPFWFDRKLNKLGIKTLVFKKMNWFNLYDLSSRDHKKIIVVDGKIGFSGSFNINDNFKDNCLMFNGKNVYNLTILFLIQWLDILNKLDSFDVKNYANFFLTTNDVKEKNNKNNISIVQMYADFPPYDDYYTNTTAGVYLNLIINARKYIYIATPYFCVTDEIKKALIDALKRKIELIIIVPKISDARISDFASYNFFNELIVHGAKIFKNKSNSYFLHSKFFIVDDLFVVTGSFNFNLRSFLSDYENSFFMFQDCVQDIKKHFLVLLNESEKCKKIKVFFLFNFFLKMVTIFC